MRCFSYTIIFLVFFFHSVLNASLYESWMPTDQGGSYVTAGLHAPNTMYLKKTFEATNQDALALFEKCLVTYCVMVIEEKDYEIDAKVEEKLYAIESFILPNEDEYQRLAAFSKRINTILPYRDTAVLGHIRRPFSYFWPTIDIYAAVEKVRGVYPLCAEYLDYLLKSPSANLENIKEQITKKTVGPINGADLLLFFAIHVFDKNGDRDIPLANNEVALLQKDFGLTGPEIIQQAIENFTFTRKPSGLDISDIDEPAAEIVIFSDSE